MVCLTFVYGPAGFKIQLVFCAFVRYVEPYRNNICKPDNRNVHMGAEYNLEHCPGLVEYTHWNKYL